MPRALLLRGTCHGTMRGLVQSAGCRASALQHAAHGERRLHEALRWRRRAVGGRLLHLQQRGLAAQLLRGRRGDHHVPPGPAHVPAGLPGLPVARVPHRQGVPRPCRPTRPALYVHACIPCVSPKQACQQGRPLDCPTMQPLWVTAAPEHIARFAAACYIPLVTKPVATSFGCSTVPTRFSSLMAPREVCYSRAHDWH